MPRLRLFGGRELRINTQALRHPIDALRGRLGRETSDVTTRTSTATAGPRTTFLPPLSVDVDTALPGAAEQICRYEIAHAARTIRARTGSHVAADHD